jgi:hypothetical protein
MCAGLGIATLIALALHRVAYTQMLPASVPTSPTSALGFVACGLALIGIGFWFPRVTSVLAMVTISLVATLAAERALATGPRVETLIMANLGGSFYRMAPNTAFVLLLGAAALLLRQARRWFERQLATIAILGSVIFAVGIVGCVGYMMGIPTYVWHTDAPMSFLSAICACVLGLGIVMSACRYSELDESGVPRWFNLVVCTGALAINVAVSVACICQGGQNWRPANVAGLAPMVIVSAALSVLAGRQARRDPL